MCDSYDVGKSCELSSKKKVQKMIRCGAPGVSQKKVRHSVVLADWMIQNVGAIFKKLTKTLI